MHQDPGKKFHSIFANFSAFENLIYVPLLISLALKWAKNQGQYPTTTEQWQNQRIIWERHFEKINMNQENQSLDFFEGGGAGDWKVCLMPFSFSHIQNFRNKLHYFSFSLFGRKSNLFLPLLLKYFFRRTYEYGSDSEWWNFSFQLKIWTSTTYVESLTRWKNF